MATYVWVNIYYLKASPATFYVFANKSREQAKERQDQRNEDLVFIRTTRLKVR